MRFDIIPRLASRRTMVLAALVIALILVIEFERGLFGALQWVTAFAFYLAVMVAAIPLATLRRPDRKPYGLTSWLALVFALAYAGNAIYVGRWQPVVVLAIGGLLVGLLVGAVAARRREPLLHHPG